MLEPVLLLFNVLPHFITPRCLLLYTNETRQYVLLRLEKCSPLYILPRQFICLARNVSRHPRRAMQRNGESILSFSFWTALSRCVSRSRCLKSRVRDALLSLSLSLSLRTYRTYARTSLSRDLSVAYLPSAGACRAAFLCSV